MENLNIFNNQLIERAFDQKSTNYWKAYVTHWSRTIDEISESLYDAHDTLNCAKTDSEKELSAKLYADICKRYRQYLFALSRVLRDLGSFYDKNGIPAAVKPLDTMIFQSVEELADANVTPVGYSWEQLMVECQITLYI